jgi:peptidoglycan hydrolase CwlO-like protein
VPALTFGGQSADKTNTAHAYDALCVTDACHKAADAQAAAEKAAKDASSQVSAYETKVKQYAAAVAQVQAQIDQNNAEITELQVQIDAANQRLETLKAMLSKTIKQLYLSGDTSALDVLASSGSLSDFVNRTAQASSLQGKAKAVAAQVEETKTKLEKDQATAKGKLAENEAAKKTAAEQQAEQQAFVAEWSNKQSEYAATADAAKKKKQAEMDAQYKIITANTGGNVVAGDPNKGRYPASNVCPGAADSYYPMGAGNGLACECYSYGIWKIYQRLGYVPSNVHGLYGPKAMYGVSGTNGGGTQPRANSAGIMTNGYYGHIVWVEGVNSDGTVNISQYNAWPKVYDYSEQYNVPASAYQWYIYY